MPGVKILAQLLEEVRNDSTLAQSAHWPDTNKIRDGIMNRAPSEMIKYTNEYTVSVDQMDEKLAEMINAISWLPSP